MIDDNTPIHAHVATLQHSGCHLYVSTPCVRPQIQVSPFVRWSPAPPAHLFEVFLVVKELLGSVKSSLLRTLPIMWHCVGTTARFQRTAEFVGSSHQQVTRLQFTISTSSAREMGRPSTVSPNAGQTCRNHLQAILGRQQSRSVSRPCRCACVSDNSKRGDQNGESSLGGSSNVQDALVDVVRLGIGKKKALEQLSDAVDDEKLKLIQKTDQVNVTR